MEPCDICGRSTPCRCYDDPAEDSRAAAIEAELAHESMLEALDDGDFEDDFDDFDDGFDDDFPEDDDGFFYDPFDYDDDFDDPIYGFDD